LVNVLSGYQPIREKDFFNSTWNKISSIAKKKKKKISPNKYRAKEIHLLL
jgi:hypothetical protein